MFTSPHASPRMFFCSFISSIKFVVFINVFYKYNLSLIFRINMFTANFTAKVHTMYKGFLGETGPSSPVFPAFPPDWKWVHVHFPH